MLKLIGKVVIIVLIIWLCLSVNQSMSYELNVNDCSNMVYRIETLCESIGIDTKVGFKKSTENSYGHVWLIFHGIPFECTNLMFVFDKENYVPEQIFDNTSKLIEHHPKYKNEFI